MIAVSSEFDTQCVVVTVCTMGRRGFCTDLYGFGFFIIFILFNQSARVSGTSGKPLWNATWTDLLKRDLFAHYDKYARPSQHYNLTAVQFRMHVYHATIDEFKSVIDVRAYIKMVWNDDKLMWKASNYGDLDHLQVGNHEVWLPDITLYNSAGTSIIDHFGNAPCHVFSTGRVICAPPAQFVTICELDLRLWPYDTQICNIELVSWAYSGDQIHLELPAGQEPTVINAIKNSEWDLKDISELQKVTTFDCCPMQPYIRLQFSLTMKRNSALYTNVLVTPTIFIVFLNLIIFWISPQNKERLILCSLLALIICIFLIYFTHMVPSLRTTPLIVSFYTGCLYQVTISLIISVVVLNLSGRKHCKPLPRIIRKILTGIVGKYLFLSDLTDLLSYQCSNNEEPRETNLNNSSLYASTTTSSTESETIKETIISSALNVNQIEWTLAASAIDKISFLFFCTVFGLMAITCMS